MDGDKYCAILNSSITTGIAFQAEKAVFSRGQMSGWHLKRQTSIEKHWKQNIWKHLEAKPKTACFHSEINENVITTDETMAQTEQIINIQNIWISRTIGSWLCRYLYTSGCTEFPAIVHSLS